mmetsp:Transcript_18554/g.25718  ORF Transcript_18554/g.25718 Transcript_18554/m.25718 type:complete len:102 (+) Transcript_18554:351-656(+)|eukprot:CAMPEP_0196588920 /NCGR_PEP_ID=MMETSP1081-20130531/62095_1 /TAXON_ID=36882 /ORGANISM="Pyramimonas amylifera, Strain CCMP720" /LENGTH=101 /DNA_ID=CAMNT_0041911565 /DNA_START=351 /DNA_END=656 /DNA_ORIENTATION=+
MYVRVKRQKQTIFLHVEASETVLELKQKVQALTDQPADEQRLFLEGNLLDDAKSLAELKVGNDAIIALIYKIDDENATWEDIDIYSVNADGTMVNGRGKPI